MVVRAPLYDVLAGFLIRGLALRQVPSIEDNTAKIHSHQFTQEDIGKQRLIGMTRYIAIELFLSLALSFKNGICVIAVGIVTLSVERGRRSGIFCKSHQYLACVSSMQA